MRRKVRGRDGAVREVSNGYVLANGEASVVDLPFMDASGRTTVTDAFGQPAGQRPGFLYSDSNEQARVDAYVTYDSDIRDRWQSQRWQSPSSAPSKPAALTFDSSEAAVAAAYVEYADAIQQRWRK